MENIFSEALPFWDELKEEQKSLILTSSFKNKVSKGTINHHNSKQCSGVEIVKKGRVRVFITSLNGGEITLYRLLSGDACILSAACMMKNLSLEISMEFEDETELVIIPKDVYKKILEENPACTQYTLGLLSEKFSDVMWLFNQYVFSNMAKRLSDALIEHISLEGSTSLMITHELLAKDLGTAREVVTRLLKQFQTDGILKLHRGRIEILDSKKLMKV